MEEQIVSLEVAKLAKKKGFDELNHVFYNRDGELIYTANCCWYKNSELGDNGVATTTQSLLQRWLREKYQIVVSPTVWEWNASASAFEYQSLIWEKEMDDEHRHIDPMSYLSWEEALEQGLLYALKLACNVN